MLQGSNLEIWLGLKPEAIGQEEYKLHDFSLGTLRALSAMYQPGRKEPEASILFPDTSSVPQSYTIIISPACPPLSSVTGPTPTRLCLPTFSFFSHDFSKLRY